MRRDRLTFVAALVLAVRTAAAGAQTPVAPQAAVDAAHEAMSDTVRGKNLRVRLVTIGQGDLVFERYGHNLLWITDTVTNEGVVWGWGNFNFDEPGFLGRFLFGTGMYMIAGDNAAAALNYYSRENREVWAQELALTPGQRAALDAFVHVNAREENRLYRYDYFLDNCSTRLRDALDIVVGGAIRTALGPRTSELSYRSETLRLNQHSAILFMGLDLALGAPSDRPLSPWYYSFVPMRLRDELQTVMVPSPDGTLVPLAGAPRRIIDAERAAEPASIDANNVRTMIVGVALVIVALALALSGPVERGSRAAFGALAALAAVVHLVSGLLASLIVFMWAFTLHAFWAWNPHLLLFTPFSLVIAALIPFARRRERLRRIVQGYHFICATIAILVAILALVTAGRGQNPEPEMLFTWAGAAGLVYLGLGVAMLRAGRPSPPDVAVATAAPVAT